MVCASGLKKKPDGNAKLLHLNKRNLELMVITRLTTMFEIFDDEQFALNSFFPGRELKTFDLLLRKADERGLTQCWRRGGRRPSFH